jgi:Phosphoesterase family
LVRYWGHLWWAGLRRPIHARAMALGTAGVLVAIGSMAGRPGLISARAVGTPIKHIVIIYQENHSFDNVLGVLCVTDHRCDGATSGKVSNGQIIPLGAATDVVPPIGHKVEHQVTAIDGGKMDRFDLISGCAKTTYACYVQFSPTQIPNLAALARAFALSDKTFTAGPMPSWGAHLDLVASQMDGFTGDNPTRGTVPPGQGWGCDSKKDTPWISSLGRTPIMVPSCVPAQNGGGPYRPSPVKWVPTIMDSLDRAGLTWNFDAGPGFYGWAICPTFADCLNGPQHLNVMPSTHILGVAKAGTLPSVSYVIPPGKTSQHNGTSMLVGDNWISKVVSALEAGPEWRSTAVFITYDDCGCFYDHGVPPAGLGIRVPMVIVSPYARPAFTDSSVATQFSMLAYIEHTFGLAPLSTGDANAYDYNASFNYRQAPLRGILLTQTVVPNSTLRQIVDTTGTDPT